VSEAAGADCDNAGREAGLGVLLVVAFATSLLSLPAVRYDGDVFAWEMEAEGLVHRGRLDVRPSVAESLPPSAPFFLFNRETGRWHSKYGVGNTLIYALPLAFERFVLGADDVDPPGSIFGKPSGAYAGTRRLALFNGFNLLLTLWLAGALYRLARLYTPKPGTAVAFVLLCLYASYLWNYTRAHSSQIYQVLFFTLAALHFVRVVRVGPGAGRRSLFWCALSLAALCSVKTVFLPLVALFALAILVSGRGTNQGLLARASANLRDHFRTYASYALLPLLALVLLLAIVNGIKFGAPWKLGYERETHLWTGRLADSIPAYLFGPRFSIFVHFPPLVLACFGLRRMWRTHRFEYAWTLAYFALLFFIYSNYTFWKGEASYGPRYLLFGLPALALPAVLALDALRAMSQRGWRTGCVALLAVGVALAVFAQVQANRLEFHAFFRLRHQFQSIEARDPELNRYLRQTNTALFNRDFIRFREAGAAPLPLARLADRLPDASYQRLETAVRSYLSSNHLFFE
jgi:hypothetical protein